MTESNMLISKGDQDSLERQPQRSFPVVMHATDFSRWRRGLFLMIVTFVGCLGPLAANIQSPLHPVMSEEFGVSPKTLDDMFYMFMGVSVVSGLVWAQLSDVYGRRCVYLISLSLLFVANLLLTALPAEINTLYGFKVLQAIGSSSVYSVGIATIVDMTPDNHRGKLFGCFTIGPSLGSVVGQIISTDHFQTQWRWGFGLLALMTGISILLIWFLLPETSGAVSTGEYSAQEQVERTFFQKKLFADDRSLNEEWHWDLHFRLLCGVSLPIICVFATVILSGFYVMCMIIGPSMTKNSDSSPRSVSISQLFPAVSLIGWSIISGSLIDLSLELSDTDPSLGIVVFGGIFVVEFGMLLFGLGIDSEPYVANAGIVIFSSTFSFVLIGLIWFSTTYAEDFPASAIALSMFICSVGCNIAYFIVIAVAKRIGMTWCFVIFMIVCMICYPIKSLLISVSCESPSSGQFDYYW